MMKKVLLADDSMTIQKVVGIIFATEDYQLTTSDDGEKALQQVREDAPDLVIADISMPGRDGFELCRAIKSDPQLAGTAVLLLPGAFDHFDEDLAQQVGADGWLTKPFASQALLDKVGETLSAEPLRLVPAEETEETGVTEPAEQPDAASEAFSAAESLDELHPEETVSESSLGLDAMDRKGSGQDAEDHRESAEDLWDTVSFDEEATAEEDASDEDTDSSLWAAVEGDNDWEEEQVAGSATEDFSSAAATAPPEMPADEELNDFTSSDNFEPLADDDELLTAMDLGVPEKDADAADSVEFAGDDAVDFSSFEENEEEPAPVTAQEWPPGDASADADTDSLTQTEPLDEDQGFVLDTAAEEASEKFFSASLEGDSDPALEDDEEPLEPLNESAPEIDMDPEDLYAASVTATEAMVPEDEGVVDLEEDEILDLSEEDIAAEGMAAGPDQEAVSPAQDEVAELTEGAGDDPDPLYVQESLEESADEEFAAASGSYYDEPFAVEDEVEDLSASGTEERLPEEDTDVKEFAELDSETSDEAVVEEPESAEQDLDAEDPFGDAAAEDLSFSASEAVEELSGEVSAGSEEELFEVASLEDDSEDDEDESAYDLSATDDTPGDVVDQVTGAAAGTSASVEAQLRQLSDEELKEVVARVAGPVIEKMAGEMLEQIVWEVVPDLAEAMIKDEIRKIKDAESASLIN